MRRHLVSAAASLAFCGTLCAEHAAAQSVYPTILSLPGSTAALSMGGAYPITSASPDVVFYNPALVRGTRGLDMEHQRYAGNSSMTSFATSSTTGLAFGVQVLDQGDATGIVIGGDRSLSPPIASTTRAGEAEGVIAYARTVHGLRLGAAGKWVQDWRSGASTGAASFDVGFTANPLNFLSVAIAGQNLGKTGSTAEFDLPRRAQLLLATDSHEVGPLDVMASGEVHMVRGGKTGGGLGAEVSYWPFNGLTFFVRGGVRMGTTSLRVVVPDRRTTLVKQGAPTAGGGVSYKRFTFEYALETFKGVSASHRFGIHIN